LNTEHAGRIELETIVRGGQLAAGEDRVRAILEDIDTREFLVWCAFEERNRGLVCLSKLPELRTVSACVGRDALAGFADALLVGWEDLLARPLAVNFEAIVEEVRQ
jgi:hypothetical protein